MVKTINDLYMEARKALLQQEDASTASLMARNLLCHITGRTPEQVIADRQLYASQPWCDELERCISRLLAGEPLAYVLGKWEFFGLPLQVDKRVLIPRDDTCAVTELAIHYGLNLKTGPRILDLCTGSGCIGLAIANRIRDARVTLGDISKDALAVAKSNITNLKLSARVSCIQVSALEPPKPFLGKFDMIVSNPPYITGQEMQELDNSVKDYEPHLALYGGEDGLDFYRAICSNFKNAFLPGGYLCFEFGMGQGDEVCRILEENGFTVLERSRDYNNIERAVIARYE